MIIPIEIKEKNIFRLVNQIWKLVPMRENGEDWKTHLDGLIIEIAGLSEICTLDLLIVLSKLKGLQVEETNFHTYRKTIFKTINLMSEVLKHDR
jgi:hypothetical protein